VEDEEGDALPDHLEHHVDDGHDLGDLLDDLDLRHAAADGYGGDDGQELVLARTTAQARRATRARRPLRIVLRP
jgi:hypothetical protein